MGTLAKVVIAVLLTGLFVLGAPVFLTNMFFAVCVVCLTLSATIFGILFATKPVKQPL